MIPRAALAGAVVLLIGPAAAQELAFRVPDDTPTPFSLQLGESMPGSLLGRLRDEAAYYRWLATHFSCTEQVVRGEKPRRGFEYLLRDTATGELEELRFDGGRTSRRRPGGPPSYEWTLLFESQRQAGFVYRYLGQELDDVQLVHRIAFRGNRFFTTGRDTREWEGVASIKAGTLRLHRIEAAPRIWAERFPAERERYRRSLKLSIGLFVPWLDTVGGRADGFVPFVTLSRRRKPTLQFLTVRFHDLPGSVAPGPSQTPPPLVGVPSAVHWRKYRMGPDYGGLQPARTRQRRYRDYRFFNVEDGDPRYLERRGRRAQ